MSGKQRGVYLELERTFWSPLNNSRLWQVAICLSFKQQIILSANKSWNMWKHVLKHQPTKKKKKKNPRMSPEFLFKLLKDGKNNWGCVSNTWQVNKEFNINVVKKRRGKEEKVNYKKDLSIKGKSLVSPKHFGSREPIVGGMCKI